MGRVVVAGSINMDVVATADRHPRIGETVAGREVLYFPGGKGANQAMAAAKLGADVSLIGRVGDDAFGEQLLNFLSAQGVDLSLVRKVARTHTGTALITVANADNTIVVIPGANALLSAVDMGEVTLSTGDVAVSQFEISLPTVKAFLAHARAAGARTILNPAPALKFDRELLALVDFLILNESELGFLTGCELRGDLDDAGFIDTARALQGDVGRTICVTLGKRGAIALIGGDALLIPGRAVEAIDTTGAGDCFVGAVAARLADGSDIFDALKHANAAASICVQRMGAAPSMPTQAEVERALA